MQDRLERMSRVAIPDLSKCRAITCDVTRVGFTRHAHSLILSIFAWRLIRRMRTLHLRAQREHVEIVEIVKIYVSTGLTTKMDRINNIHTHVLWTIILRLVTVLHPIYRHINVTIVRLEAVKILTWKYTGMHYRKPGAKCLISVIARAKLWKFSGAFVR